MPFGVTTSTGLAGFSKQSIGDGQRDDIDGVVTYERGVVRMGMAFLVRDERNDIYTPLEHGRGEWPSDSFGDRISLVAGVHARVIERGALIEEKSAGYGDRRAQAKDRMDVRVLTVSDTQQRPEPDSS